MATTVITKGSIALSAAISASGTRATPGSTTVYTVPANSYAIVSLRISGGGVGSISLDGSFFAVQPGSTFTTGVPVLNIYCGAASAINVNNTSGTTTLDVIGVLFTNT